MKAPADRSDPLGSLIRLGRIAEVDRPAARCVVDLGEITSGPVPWLACRAGAKRTWSPPSIGEQVILLCPEGDLGLGVALLGLYSDARPAPSIEDLDRIEYDNGAWFGYDPGAADELSIVLVSGGKIRIVAPGGVSIQGDVAIDGQLRTTGDVVAGDISMQNHGHGLVKLGTDKSGKALQL